MTLPPGRLGPYQILSPLGSGGMGEVYRARDTRLGRDVAVKVLPSELAFHHEQLQRFEREARAASALNHPNIVALYDVGREQGIDYLVMELVEGETLLERLTRGPLPIEHVLRYGAQICSALAACHQKGMVHRDLKPGNVMLTQAGVKLVDFGLARAFETTPSPEASSSAPTAAAPVTGPGVVVGTLAYMAPEQLQGAPVDARCDIFALGAVLFEATTGRRAFAGDTNSAIATAILASVPPPVSTLAPGCPRGLDQLIQYCLEKDPERRFRSAHDVGLQLSAASQVEPASLSSGSRRSRSLAVLGALVLVGVGVALFGLLLRDFAPGETSAPARVVRFRFTAPSRGEFLTHVEGPLLAVSPEGSRIAFIVSEAESGSKSGIWVREVDELEPRAISGTENAKTLFWSHDGRSIAFFTATGQLKRVDLSAPGPVTLADLPTGAGRIGTWGAREILFSSVQGESIYRISPDGGEAELVLEPDAARGELRTSWPWFLPDGTTFLFLLKLQGGDVHAMLARPGAAPQDVGLINSQVQYVEPGILVYVKESVLLAQRFDAREGRLDGAPFALAPEVRYFQSTGWAAFATSPTGTLAYRSEGAAMRLIWFDRAGENLGSVSVAGQYYSLAISADGRRVLFDRVQRGLGTFDVWSLDLERGVETRLTAGPDTEAGTRWLPDGTGIVYFGVRGASPQLIRRDLASGREELLFPRPGFQEPMDVSPDGRTLLFSQRDTSGLSCWTLPLDEGEHATPKAFLPAASQIDGARFSPDGGWVSFVSKESDRYEAYVVSSSGSGERFQVSKEGARVVRWGSSGRELVYLSHDGRLFSVSVALGSKPRFGETVELFRLPERSAWNSFEVAPDGRRFLAIVPEPTADERASVVLNFPALLDERLQ